MRGTREGTVHFLEKTCLPIITSHIEVLKTDSNNSQTKREQIDQYCKTAGSSHLGASEHFWEKGYTDCNYVNSSA